MEAKFELLKKKITLDLEKGVKIFLFSRVIFEITGPFSKY